MADGFRINCCFCGDDIETFCNAVAMTVTLGAGGTQELWSHATCLLDRLHESVHLPLFEREDTGPKKASPTS